MVCNLIKWTNTINWVAAKLRIRIILKYSTGKTSQHKLTAFDSRGKLGWRYDQQSNQKYLQQSKWVLSD
jgi:hypothetical protein